MKQELELQPGRKSTYQFTVQSQTGTLHIRTERPSQVKFYFATYGGEEKLYYQSLYINAETNEPMVNLPEESLMRIESTNEIEEIYIDWPSVSLITPAELSQLSRMCFADDDKAKRFIDEAEQNDIRKNLGNKLYSYIVENRGILGDLLNGCPYTAGSETRYHSGLKKALAYYAYSRLIVGGNVELTRAGVVNRDSDYSHQSDTEERQQTSRETAAIADRYINEVLDYCRNHETLRLYVSANKFKETNRTSVKIIGE